MSVSPDLLQAFLEGKLAGEEATGVAAEIANSPELAAYVEEQKALRSAEHSSNGLNRLQTKVAANGANWIAVAAMAAGIALGVLLAGSFGIGTDMRSQNGTLIAQGELAQVLNTALSAADNRNARIRVGASIWSKNGAFCRSFVMRGGSTNSLAGLACRENSAWHVPVTAAVDLPQSEDVPVAALLPASVRAVMENLIVGEPLSDEAERQARSQAWRPS